MYINEPKTYPNEPMYNILLNENKVPTIAPNIVDEPNMSFVVLLLDVLSIILSKIDDEIVSNMKGKNSKIETTGSLKVNVKTKPRMKCSIKKAKI